MISGLKEAVYNRLAGTETLSGVYAQAQTKLLGLLGSYIEDGTEDTVPCIFYMNKDNRVDDADLSEELYPYPRITYREHPGPVDFRFRDGFSVESPCCLFEVWDNAPDALVASEIAHLICFLFEKRFDAPKLEFEDAKHYDSFALLTPESVYDHRTNMWSVKFDIRFTLFTGYVNLP